jgi:hypothetical protein
MYLSLISLADYTMLIKIMRLRGHLMYLSASNTIVQVRFNLEVTCYENHITYPDIIWGQIVVDRCSEWDFI